MWRLSLFLILIGIPFSATAQTCYQLQDAQGRTIYESRTPPYSLAYPPDNDPRREASRLRGEQLVIIRDRNCGLARPIWTSPPAHTAQPTGTAPEVLELPFPAPARPSTAVQHRPEHAAGRSATEGDRNRAEPSPQERFFLILQYPRVFSAAFFESVPAAILMYFLVWGGFRLSRGSAFRIGFSRHLSGLIITLLGSAAIRLFAYLTFAGGDAYSPSVETGEAAVYFLVIPGIVAAVYLGITSDNASRGRAEGSSPQEGSTATDGAYGGEKSEFVRDRKRFMNERQRIILIVVAVVIALMLLFPPHVVSVGAGTSLQGGYSFILNLPRRATVDIGVLLVQWLGVVFVGGIAFFLSKDRD